LRQRKLTGTLLLKYGTVEIESSTSVIFDVNKIGDKRIAKCKYYAEKRGARICKPRQLNEVTYAFFVQKIEFENGKSKNNKNA